ncbi:MAG: hypothetical protein ACFHX7_01210 [Pseudomonadota bacterium]
MESPEPDVSEQPGHWQLLRDLLAFQWKLLLDGLRDLFLVPISIAAALLGFIISPGNPGLYFEGLMKLGHKSDRWINLFGSQLDDMADTAPSADQVVARIEDMLRREYEKGGIVRSAKEQTDELIRRIRKEL